MGYNHKQPPCIEIISQQTEDSIHDDASGFDDHLVYMIKPDNPTFVCTAKRQKVVGKKK